MNPIKLLFVSATQMEIQRVLDTNDFHQTDYRGATLFASRSGQWACLVTGPGVLNTAAGLASLLSRSVPELVIDVGIAGVFPGSGLGIGDLALAETDTYVHSGVGKDRPLPFDLIPGMVQTRRGLYTMDSRTLSVCRDLVVDAGLSKPGSGPFLTVSRITDTSADALALASEGGYLMESMEGAAVAHVCALHQVPMAQLRAGSNRVGDREKSRWDIPAACRNLNTACDILSRRLS